MGKVVAEIHVLPVDVNVDFKEIIDGIKRVIPTPADFKDSKIVPIAFGLEKAVLTVIVDDAEGATQSVEDAISSVPGVEEVKVERVTLL
ncbi:MAG: elongation factor 1-beta [Candidatus Ranarchaeia archaeon]